MKISVRFVKGLQKWDKIEAWKIIDFSTFLNSSNIAFKDDRGLDSTMPNVEIICSYILRHTNISDSWNSSLSSLVDRNNNTHTDF